ncbi:putrescine aminotransferase [Limnochorda pilosa]|uniref:Putrescine--2-oxoglutarate aminotransferase n=1 Tax=Limnochorda pilosa TaxID=1555112 RepID=A0A0K2SLP0_LIMPI|nr:putrescine aminotransferase [Limnochorda pilosa]BAS27927.1 putrescine--2-oxoglutarate aminotransferase [Limnochorda pilosa]
MERDQLLKETGYVLGLIHKDRLSPDEQEHVVQEVVRLWKDHVNEGFLQYRKSVSDDYTAVEWSDELGGTVFYDARGREYIDCLGGFGIYSAGHRHPKVLQAVRAQLEKQAIHSQELLDPLRTYLARLLSLITPGKLQYAFLTNSGTESVEACLKMAVLTTGRHRFVAATGAFHGKTLGALSGTSKATFRQPFLPLLHFTHVPWGDVHGLKAVFEGARFSGDDVAAVVLEPIQGEGGINVPPDGYLQAARELCDAYGALLIFDEVQTGMGRTGRWFACEHWRVTPDLIALGKGLGGGVMPIGACVGTPNTWKRYIENPFLHTTTFGGNPLACAAAVATIHVLAEEDLVEEAARKGIHLLSGFQQLAREYPDILVEARGKGLMIGLEFTDHATGYAVARGLFNQGVLVSGTYINSKVIRMEPPLTISQRQMDAVLERLEAALRRTRAGRMATR